MVFYKTYWFQYKTLSVGVTTDRNGYQYRCKLTGNDGSEVYKEAAALLVEIDLVAHPQDQVGVITDNVQFSVQATGVAAYQWQYRSANSNTWKNTGLEGCYTDTLTVPMITSRNNYLYRWKLTGENGTVIYTEEATLVMDAHISVVTPGDQTALEGSEALIALETEGIISYRWYYRKGEGDSWHTTAMSGYVTDTLRVKVTTHRDGYQYRCKMRGEDGYYIFSEPATLYVATSIILQPSNQIAQSGDYVRFSVGAKGIGLAYQWQYSSNGGEIWNNTNMTGSNTAALSVEVTAGRNGYRYRCKITDKNGNITYSDEAILTVE